MGADPAWTQAHIANKSLVLQDSMPTCMHSMLQSNMHITLQDSMLTRMHPMLHFHMHHMHAIMHTMYAAYSHACKVPMQHVCRQLPLRTVVLR